MFYSKNIRTPNFNTFTFIMIVNIHICVKSVSLDHPDFRVFYNQLHPDLVEYLVAVMSVFAGRKLS